MMQNSVGGTIFCMCDSIGDIFLCISIITDFMLYHYILHIKEKCSAFSDTALYRWENSAWVKMVPIIWMKHNPSFKTNESLCSHFPEWIIFCIILPNISAVQTFLGSYICSLNKWGVDFECAFCTAWCHVKGLSSPCFHQWNIGTII